MSHLSLEDLARLLDEEPSMSEAEHLEGCTLCQRELAALRTDRDALGDLPDLLPPPPNAWPDLAERLRAEGLMRDESRHETIPGPARAVGQRFLRLAAALALILLGGGAGYLIRGGEVTGQGASGPVAYRPGVGETTSPANGTTGAAGEGSDEVIAAAALALRAAETEYRLALTRYNDLALGGRADTDRLSRLAELAETPLDPNAAGTAQPRGLAPAGGRPLDDGATSEHWLHYLAGVATAELNSDLARYFAGVSEGVLVLRVTPQTPAAHLGLVAGDVVTAVAGTPVRTIVALRAALDQAAGSTIGVEVIRQGERLELRLRP